MTDIVDERDAQEVSDAVKIKQDERHGISLSLKDVSVNYDGIKALANVTFEARAGDKIGIIGNSGAGKTTLCNVISGIVRPQLGSVFLNEKDCTKRSPRSRARKGIRRVFEHSVYFDFLSIVENVLIGSPPYRGEGLVSALITPRIFNRERTETARRILEYCNVDVDGRDKIVMPNYITKRKVELARALMGNPRILILDEPTKAMNETDKAQYCQVVADYVDTFSTTLILVEQDMEVVRTLCNRAIALDAGEMLADGEVVPVLRNDDVIARFLTTEVKK